MNPSISIILPFFNREWSLERAIQSVQNQTFSSWECLLIDDGSTDSSGAMAKEFVRRDPRFKLYSLPENSGVSSARNLGIEKAKAPLLAFLDSDDEWLPEKLSKHLKFHQTGPFKISQTTEQWIRNGKAIKIPKHLRKPTQKLYEFSLQTCAITPSSVFIDADLLDIVGKFDPTLPSCEDYDLWLRITPFFEVGLLEENLLVRYGGHKDQLSAKYPIMDRFRIRSIQNLLQNPRLNSDQRKAAEKTALKKMQIMVGGAQKRGNLQLIADLEAEFPDLFKNISLL